MNRRETQIHLANESLPQLTDLQKESYPQLISKAKDAYTFAPQSGFRVLTAGLMSNGDVVTGGNKEYAFSDAFIHGETSVLSQALDRYGQAPRAIAFYNESSDKDLLTGVTPCGNCRDILSQFCDHNMTLMAGNENIVVVSRLSELLFEPPATIETSAISPQAREAVKALQRGIDVYLPAERKGEAYGVALIGKQYEPDDPQNYKHVAYGSLYTNAGYDAITPGVASVVEWINSPQKKVEDISHVIVAGSGALPKVFYRDRQAILELDEASRPFSNRKAPVSVELINFDTKNEQVTQTAKTNTSEWLPYSFSPGTFGMHDVLSAQFRKLSQ